MSVTLDEAELAFLEAMEGGDHAAAIKLVEEGKISANHVLKRSDNMPILNYSIIYGSAGLVKALLKQAANPNKTGQHVSAVHLAAGNDRYYEHLKLLAQNKLIRANLSATSGLALGKTPLEWARHCRATKNAGYLARVIPRR